VNGRKYAWQIFHAEMRRQVAADEGLELHPQFETMAAVLRAAHEDGVSSTEVILGVANLGATFATMALKDPLAVASRLGETIMAEPDDADQQVEGAENTGSF
jgi:hypothetical protein